MQRRHEYLIIAAAGLVATYSGYVLFVVALHAANEHISRCLDHSAPQYVVDSEQRRRECGSG
jgi:hypothetical protein